MMKSKNMNEYVFDFSFLKKSDLGKIHDFSTDEGHNVLWQYLRGEFKQGKTEFRISFLDGVKFIIHPLNKDGDTLDFVLTKNNTI